MRINDINQTEEDFLRNYDSSAFEKPITSVDIVIFTVLNNHLHVLTIKRAEHPFKDLWSLVGGFIDLQNDADLESAAMRKLKEKTGVKSPYLEQFGTIGNRSRDPREWSVTTVYFALIPCHTVKLQPGKGTIDIKWSKVIDGKIKDKLAFDHSDILAKCTERLRSKVLYTSLPIYLMPKDFTLGELQKVYEVILDKKIDHKSFRRRILNAEIIEDIGKMRHEGKRPAHLYQLKEMNSPHFFVRNIEGAS